MKRALVLSGGGAKGAFQFGALKYIRENRMDREERVDHFFRIISGVSVGSLNGVMLAMNKFKRLEQLWDTITDAGIYTGRLRLLRIIWRILTRRTSVLGNDPLKKLLEEYISLSDIDTGNCDFRFGTVSVVTGRYYSFHADDFDDDEQFRNGILGSTAMPVIWPPVDSITTAGGETVRQLVDGGIRNITPLGDVIDDDPDEVVIINCNSPHFSPYPGIADSMLKIAQRALTEITINEIFRQDLDKFARINSILHQLPPGTVVRKFNGTLYKKYKSIIIEPAEDIGDSMDFSRTKTEWRIRKGYERAREVYEMEE